MITVLDYGMGNVGSVCNMIKRLDHECLISADKEVIASAKKLIIPGVGSFDSAINRLRELGMIDIIRKKAKEKDTYILGICLGMQLLFQSSEEGVLPGLGLIAGSVKKFNEKEIGRRIPHIGWNYVDMNEKSRLFSKAEPEQRFYFVHSFYVAPADDACLVSMSNYGIDFVSAVEKDNIMGVQFHPEKSHRYGKALLKNFLDI